MGSGLKTTIVEIEPRIDVKPNKTEGIQNYDIDNAYPQRTLILIESSGAAQTGVDYFSKFIRGGGFKDVSFGQSTSNRKDQPIDEILRLASLDYARFFGFALHINYNAALDVREVQYLPFHDARLMVPDDTGFVGKIAVHKDWARLTSKKINKKDIEKFDVYNPDKAAIMRQIEAAGGIQNYKGQVFWFSNRGDAYPLSPADPVIEDVETDSEIKLFKKSTTKRGFMAGHLFLHKGKFEDRAEKEEFIDDLQQFESGENAGSMLLVEIEREEQKPEIEAFDYNIDDKIFEHWESTTQNNIRRRYGVPPVFWDATPGKLGEGKELLDAIQFYNEFTKDDRRIFEKIFPKIYETMPSVPTPTTDKIEKFKPEEDEDESTETPPE